MNSNDVLFKDTDAVISEPLKFKAKLAIGEDAYTSMRMKKAVSSLWDTIGASATGVTVAQSSVVAGTFFAPSGFLTAIGLGGAAVTPICWVVAAGVVSGVGWASVSKLVQNQSNDKVTVIPDFINTPMDVLALGLFDLLAPLAMKVAKVDESIELEEKQYICNYFINEWGYDRNFVNNGIPYIEQNLEEFSIKELASTLAEFKRINPDCNYKEMAKEIILFLRGVMTADGEIDEREEMAIEKVEDIFKEASKIKIKDKFKSSLTKIRRK